MRIGIMALAALALALAGCTRRMDNAPPSGSTVGGDAPTDARAVLTSLGVDIYPNAKPVDGISVSVTEVPEGHAYTTAWRTTDPAAKVIAFYANRLRNALTNDKEMRHMVVGETSAGDGITVVTSREVKVEPKRSTSAKNRGGQSVVTYGEVEITLITITVRKQRR